MQLRDRHEQLKGAFRTSLSPPVWKDQLKQRCMQRLRQDRHKLLAKLRSPEAMTSITDEMKRLVYTEERRGEESAQPLHVPTHAGTSSSMHRRPRQHSRRTQRASEGRHPVFDLQSDDASMSLQEEFESHQQLRQHHTDEDMDEDAALNYASIEELVAAGKLSEDDYLDIVHSLEDELLAEMYGDVGVDTTEEQLAQQMVEFEEASLEAMLAGMDLGDSEVYYGDEDFDEFDCTSCGGGHGGMHVLCPICKVGSLKETASSGSSAPAIACACGFSYEMQQEPFHGVLEDFQEIIANAFMAHRERCCADPSFEKAQVSDQYFGSCDAVRIICHECGTNSIVP